MLAAINPYNAYNAPILKAYHARDAEFNQVVKEARQHPVSEKEIQPTWIGKLQKLARSPEWNETVGDYVMRTHPQEMKALRDQYEKRTLLLEKKENEKAPSTNYSQLNTSFADLEAQSSGMNANSRAVFVGSGPQPNSVLAYAKLAGKVTGIDINPDAIKATKQIAKNSSGKIDFQLSKGEEFDYSPYSHIGIAVMVPDKDKILAQIRKTAAPGAKVIVRSVDGLKNAMYQGFDASNAPGFSQVATVHGTNQNITHAMLLQKKPLDIVG